MFDSRTNEAYAIGPLRGLAGDLLIFSLASGLTYLTQQQDRPITAVLIYLSGVIMVGARSGLRRGLIAAVAASLSYNFFLSEPVFRFGASSLDEIVPLLAFNLSAILTGALVGRLKDSAKLARAAEAENALLLRISDGLQKAIRLSDVEEIVRSTLPGYGVTDLEIYLRKDRQFYRPALADEPVETIEALLPNDSAEPPCVGFKVYELRGTGRELGFVRFTFREQSEERRARDLQPLANLLALAVDRCQLLEQLSEARAHQRSEELKSAILSSVSHDLRTPLTAIEAAASGLQSFDQGLTTRQKDEMLTTIAEQCRKLNRYTANLLAMGRIQSGISPSRFEDIDLIEILGVVLSGLRHSFPEQPIRKEIHAGSALVRANGPMLEQAIFNVFENAVVHGSSSDPLRISLSTDEQVVRLDIEDSGPGIAQADLPHVFDRFYRSNQPSHRRGSGLGLYIAKGFINAFGGTISVACPGGAGKGTRIAIALPIIGSTRTTGTSA